MPRERVLSDDARMYELTRDQQGREFLTVLCGGIAAYEVTIMLTDDEIRRRQEWGKEWFLDDLAYKVAMNEEGIQARAIHPPDASPQA